MIFGTIIMVTPLFLQTTPPPADLVTLQWIIIVTLASALAYLYRQLRKTEERNNDTQTELIEKTLVGLGDANEAIRGLADVIEALQEQLDLRREFEELRRELRHGSK